MRYRQAKKNKSESIKCLTCQILNSEIIPPGGIILQTKYWSCDHAYDIALPGFLFLKTNRHVESVVDLNENEAKEFGTVLLSITKAINKILRPERIYVLRYGEVIRHVHFWLLPRTKEVLKNCGKGPEAIRSIVEFYRDNYSMKNKEKEIIDVVEKLKGLLSGKS